MATTSDGAVVLLTGATGFVGKAVLYQLCRTTDVTTIFLLVRSSRGLSADERVRQILFDDPNFAALDLAALRRVRVVCGDLLDLPTRAQSMKIRKASDLSDGQVELSSHVHQMGIDPADYAELRSRTTAIIHCAASVEFDQPLREAARINIGGTLAVLELASACTRLHRLVYCSSAYAVPSTRLPIHEVPIRPESTSPLHDVEAFWSALQEGANGRGNGEAGRTPSSWPSPREEQELLRRSGHPNTYTLTKAAAELLLARRHSVVPLTIVRPSIVGAARATPSPGWAETASGVAAFAFLIRLGAMHTVTGLPNTPLDVVPVDDVATRLRKAAMHGAGAGSLVSLRGGHLDPHVEIVHAVAGVRRSVTVERVAQTIVECQSGGELLRRPPGPLGPIFVRFVAPRRSLARMISLGADILLLLCLQCLAWLLGRAHQAQRLAVVRRKLLHVDRLFEHFTSTRYDFRSSSRRADELLADPDAGAGEGCLAPAHAAEDVRQIHLLAIAVTLKLARKFGNKSQVK
jgi:fatty acyl-CoA reductase